MKKSPNTGPLPSFFRAAIATARRGRSVESDGYETAGYQLARVLRVNFNYECENPDAEVDGALDGDDPPRAVWELIRRTAPRCAALVPPRRRRKFIEGIARAIDEQEV